MLIAYKVRAIMLINKKSPVSRKGFHILAVRDNGISILGDFD